MSINSPKTAVPNAVEKTIKALTTAFMVFSTAFGTAVFGLLIDNGFTIENIAFTGIIYILISLFLLVLIRKKVEPVRL